MALDPSLPKIIQDAAAAAKNRTGIISFEQVESDDRDYLIFEVASLINDALTGPAIHVMELAEMIVDKTQSRQ